MRLAKAPVAIGLTAALMIGGGIVAFADGDTSSTHSPPHTPLGASPASPVPASSSPAATSPTPTGQAPCGPATAEVLARVAGQVAERIYDGELHGGETLSDRSQIAGYDPLVRAMRERNQSAVRSAVNELVFSHTHIVRLRVSSSSRLWADIGGPYILAPVRGQLRSAGRTIGRFVFSVQDDLGYIKLVARFIGVPLVLRTTSGQVPVPGQAATGSAKIPDRGTFSYRGARYQAYSFKASAYPEGPLRVSLLVPQPPGLAARSCPQVAAEQVANVARHISRRFSLATGNIATYASLVHTLTNAVVYVHAGGHTYAAGSRRVPRRIPSSGPVRIGGRTYTVSSSTVPSSAGPARVQVLVTG